MQSKLWAGQQCKEKNQSDGDDDIMKARKPTAAIPITKESATERKSRIRKPILKYKIK